jgi:integrase/recombinase XerD
MPEAQDHEDQAKEKIQLHLLQEKKLALGTIALRMGALRFLYKKTLKRRDLDFDDLPLLKKPKKLPVVLSPEEVTRLIEAAPNLLYRTLLVLLYACAGARWLT